MFFFELLQAFNSMDERQGINGALIEQISGNDYEIDRTMSRLVDNVPESAAEIVKAFAHTILFIAQVCVRYVNKRSSHESLRIVMAIVMVQSSRHGNRRQQ